MRGRETTLERRPRGLLLLLLLLLRSHCLVPQRGLAYR